MLAAMMDAAWERALDRDPVAALRYRGSVDALPPGGPAAMAHDVTVARDALSRLGAIDAADLDAAFLADHLRQEVAEQERFWYRFPVTPYNAFTLSSYRTEILGAIALNTATDVERYLALLDGYAGHVEQIGATMTAQRQRGIRLPAWSAPACIATVRGNAEESSALIPGPDRTAGLAPGLAGRLADTAARMVTARVTPAYQGLIVDLGTDARDGGDGVGIGAYAGGADCYHGLIRLHTGLDLTAEQVHAIGVDEVARLTGRIRDELGVTDEVSYRRRLDADPRLYAADPATLERLFQRHIDRLEPLLPRMFARMPAAPFRLRRLDASLGGLTYGFYESPAGDGVGYYHYNAADLPHRPLAQAASVIFHEGMPGHHLQVGRQLENTALHPLRREPTELRTFALNGYAEGWAEYAAGLCEELGLYADPLDHYGRLTAERFHAARLVVDTGLNVLGWSRDRASAYLREHAVMSEPEIDSEVLRYAVDDPGQALAYHIGHWFLRDLRGQREPRAFHEDVLAEGPLPLAVLAGSLAG